MTAIQHRYVLSNFNQNCGSVGRVVASDNRDPWFKSIRRQILYTINCIEKKKYEENKRPSVAKIFRALFAPLCYRLDHVLK